jgi:hypothetical protein
MEVLKLAFETVIIGLFALPWLWVMIDLVKPDLLTFSNIKSAIVRIPAELRPPAIGLTLFAIVYLLGSMITPVSYEFLNDPDMLAKYLPAEKTIQKANFKEMIGADRDVLAKVGHVNCQDSKADSDKPDCVNVEFLEVESTLLLRASDDSERLNRLHEQLTVLQGATFSAFALTVLCGFAWCGRYRKTVAGSKLLRQQIRCSVALVISSAMIVWSGWGFVADFLRHSIYTGDMPIAELVLLVLGCFGLYVAVRGTQSRLKFHGLTFVFGFCFTLLCYTGYGCTEKSYSEAVITTYNAAQGGDSAPAVNRPMLATISE